jgi:hypothetical protein
MLLVSLHAQISEELIHTVLTKSNLTFLSYFCSVTYLGLTHIIRSYISVGKGLQKLKKLTIYIYIARQVNGQ